MIEVGSTGVDRSGFGDNQLLYRKSFPCMRWMQKNNQPWKLGVNLEKNVD